MKRPLLDRSLMRKRMKPYTTVIALLAFMLCACATAPTPTGAGATFVVVRHAEKGTDAGIDPSLSVAGHQRAAALAEHFAGTKLVAIYSTPYRRTQETALPAAQKHGLPITSYNPSQPVGGFAHELLQRHSSGTVLVVGHSNTGPEIVAALCACEVAPLGEQDYDRLFIVRVGNSDRAELIQERY